MSSVGTEFGKRIKNVSTAQPGEPYWNNVTLLLNGDDLVDHSNLMNTCTTNGSTTYNTSIKKFGTGSLSLPGNNNTFKVNASAQTLLGTNNDFTVEFWCNIASNGNWACIIGQWDTNVYTGSQSWAIGYDTTGKISASIKSGDGTTSYSTTATTMSYNTWHHVAFVRNGNTFTLYLDGVYTSSFTYSGAIATGLNYLTINGYNNGFSYFSGYLDDIRITKGVARYTYNFTPSTTAWPTSYAPAPVGPAAPVSMSLSPFLGGDEAFFFGVNDAFVALISMGTFPTSFATSGTSAVDPMMTTDSSALAFNMSSAAFLLMGAQSM